jgi:ribosomal RNA assembly protein
MQYKIEKEKILAFDIVKIPADRLAVVIGKAGSTKAAIQKATKTKIKIDENVEISGQVEGVLKAVNIVKAIGRGFSPARAFNLLKQDWVMEVISLKGQTPANVKRLFGRVIGRAGTSRHIIEKATGCLISVYGWTITIIGPEEAIGKAVNAVEQLLAGRTHGFVFKKLKTI